MKSILLSVKPEWVVKILNGKKTIEVRKKFPKDFKGWVYIYCTKGNKREYLTDMRKDKQDFFYCDDGMIGSWGCEIVNGKVVARFWCDKVEETFFQQEESFNNEIEKTLKSSCLTYDELWNYVENKTFYKIHVSELEIFDKPKELSEFGIKIAAQNYCYIEVDEQ